MSVGFFVTRNHDWNNVPTEDAGGFADNDLQEFLLGYFTVGGEAVDPCDGACFSGAQLDQLVSQLESAIEEISPKPSHWPFDTLEQIVAFHERLRVYGIEDLGPRDHALKTMKRGIELARRARKRDENLLFIGD